MATSEEGDDGYEALIEAGVSVDDIPFIATTYYGERSDVLSAQNHQSAHGGHPAGVHTHSISVKRMEQTCPISIPIRKAVYVSVIFLDDV